MSTQRARRNQVSFLAKVSRTTLFLCLTLCALELASGQGGGRRQEKKRIIRAINEAADAGKFPNDRHSQSFSDWANDVAGASNDRSNPAASESTVRTTITPDQTTKLVTISARYADLNSRVSARN